MLLQKLTTLAAVLLRSSWVQSALLPSEYIGGRDDDAFNNTLEDRDNTHDLNPAEQGMLDNLDNTYEGIYW